MKRLGTVLMVVGACALLLWSSVAPVFGQASGIDAGSSLRMQIELINRLAVGLTTVTDILSKNYTQSWSDGTGANQAKAIYHANRTISASGSETLDLNASLTDAFGASFTCTAVKALVVHAATGNTNNVLVGGGSTDITTIFSDTSDRLIIRPNGTLMLTAPDTTGYAITAGSADQLTFANSGGSTSVNYDLTILCEE